MKHPLLALATASALFMAACGDDNSSNAKTDNPATSSSSISGTSDNISSDTSNNPATINRDSNNQATSSSSIDESSSTDDDYDIVITGTFSIDSDNDLIQLTADKPFEDICVAENGSYDWKSVSIYSKPSYMNYEFHGDSLYLFSIYEGEIEDFADIYVGGAPGNIHGDWTYTHCIYDSETKKKDCDDQNRIYYHQVMSFNEGKVVSKVKFNLDLYNANNSDYMNSYFIAQLISSLGGGEPYVNAKEIWYMDSAAVRDYAADWYAEFKEKTKTNATFKLKGKTYTVNVLKAERILQLAGYYRGMPNEECQLTVSDGEKTCTLNYELKYVDEALCNAQNAEYLVINKDLDVDDGDEVDCAYAYKKSNRLEFNDCLKEIAVPQIVDPAPDAALYKKATAPAKRSSTNSFNSWKALFQR